MGVWLLFKGRDPGGTALRSGYLGGHPLHGKGPGGDPYLGGKTADGTAPTEDNRQEVEIYLCGGGKGGGGVLDDGLIRQAAPAHSCTVHFYAITVRPV